MDHSGGEETLGQLVQASLCVEGLLYFLASLRPNSGLGKVWESLWEIVWSYIPFPFLTVGLGNMHCF